MADSRPSFERVRPGLPEVLESFDEILAAVDSEAETDAVLHLVAREICALIGCSRCSVYLKETEKGLFCGHVAESRQPHADERVRRLVCGTAADGFTREILATKRPVLIRDATGRQSAGPLRDARLGASDACSACR